MWLEAIITREDLVDVMREILPTTVDLGEGAGDASPSHERWLKLEPATDVVLVPDRGLRVVCSAALQWSLAGLSTPTIRLERLSLFLHPEIVDRNNSHLLEFQLEIEDADVPGVPGLVDGAITRAVNTALAARRLSWNFSQTLSHTLGLGSVADLDAVKIDVRWGEQRITKDALALVVSLKLHFLREPPPKTPG